MSVVSSTGAVGIGQLEPSTVAKLRVSLGQPGLQATNTSDNIEMAAAYLHQLLIQTQGDAGLALAGYYQGLNSVRRSGMFPSTVQYVNGILAFTRAVRLRRCPLRSIGAAWHTRVVGTHDGDAPMSIATRRDTLLPDPAPRPVRYTVISVDDHLVEPPDMFEGRLPRRFADRAPKIIENARGHQLWEFDGSLYSQVGMNAVAGRRPECVSLEPTRFEDMRRGCWDIDARIADMDINGVWASLNFPSQITGFSGKVFSAASDPQLGLAVTRAWNDWLYEAWWQPYPDRIIPCGITFLTDAERGADEIRRNADRGFRSVTLPERPHRIGLPSLFSGYWDPIIGGVRRDRHRHLAPRRLVGNAGHARGRSSGRPGRDPVRADVPVGLRRMGLVRTADEVPGSPDRHERRGHRLGGHAARPARQHRRPVGVRPRLRSIGAAPGRCAPAQLLVLHHRRPVDHRHP